nr:hypothetical protein [Methylomonas sp. MK1]
MEFSRYSASATLFVLMACFIFFFSQKPAKQGH